ncbi:hypothetical protein Tco_1475056 [Tanacetum coccineum]
MNPIVSQQVSLDNSLVTPEKRLKIERCNARIAFISHRKKKHIKLHWKLLSYLLVIPLSKSLLKSLKSLCIKKIGKIDAYDFKLDKKKCRVDTEKKIYSHLSRNLVTLASVTCYLPFKLIKCTSLRGHLMLSLTDFMYQADNKEISSARKEHMPYPRFTKVIIDHFISKDNSISMRNIINLHTTRDDSLLGALKFISKIEDCQKYGLLIPDGMINDDIKLSTTYKTYLDYATRNVPPKKVKRVKRPAKKATTTPSTGVVIRDTPDKLISKKIAPTKTDRGKGIELLSDAALLEDAQLKKTLRKIKRETHKLQASGSSKEADFESEVPNEQIGRTNDTSEGAGVKPGVLDVSKDSSDNDDDDENPSFTLKDYEEEEHDEEYVFTPEKDKSDDEEKMYEEEDDDVAKELYEDLNITQGLRDTDMTNAEQGREDLQNPSHESGFVQEEDDGHVTLTTVHDKTEGTMQSSSVSYDFTSKLLNLDNTGPDVNKIASLMNTSTFNQTNQFAEAVSSIPDIIDQYLASKMKEAVDVVVRLQANKLKEEAKAENQEFFNQVDSTMKEIIKEHVKAQVSKIMPQIEKYVTESLGAEVLVRLTNQPQTSYAVVASLSEF